MSFVLCSFEVEMSLGSQLLTSWCARLPFFFFLSVFFVLLYHKVASIQRFPYCCLSDRKKRSSLTLQIKSVFKRRQILKLLFEQRHHLCSFTKSNYLLSCLWFSWQSHSVGCLRVYRVSLSEHYRNGTTYSFYFTWVTIHLNDTASLAIHLAGGHNNLNR